jgi:hypothetical protein
VVGFAHVLFGDWASIGLAFIPGLLVLSLALLLQVLVPAAPKYIGFTFLGIAPLWYWSSKVYMGSALAFMFISTGLLFFAFAIRQRSLSWFFVSSSAFALAGLMRHAEATLLLIIGLAFTVAFIRRLKDFRWKQVLRVIGIYAAAQGFMFLLPMALLNWWTYGSPLTTGYFVFWEQQFPERLPAAGNVFVSMSGLLKAAFFPVPPDLGTLSRGVWYQIFLMTPLILPLGVAGFYLVRKSLVKTFGYGGVALLILALVYVLVSRADPGTFGAATAEPKLSAALVRYYLPIYVALGIGTAIALSYASRSLCVSVILWLLAWSTYQVWVGSSESIVNQQRFIDTNTSRYELFLESYTEPNALVVTGVLDKWTTPVRRTVGFWQTGGADSRYRSLYDPEELAESAASISHLGIPVYFLFRREGEDIEALKEPLSKEVLEVNKLAEPEAGVELWRVIAPPMDLDTEYVKKGIYQTNISSLGTHFMLRIEQVGPIRNHIVNPSFEESLKGWEGPGAGGRVLRTDEEALFGRFSMRMESSPAQRAGESVRRTHNRRIEMKAGEIWTARSRVVVSQLLVANVEMRVFVSDKEGQEIERYTTSLGAFGGGFQLMTIQGQTLPHEASSISVQLRIVSSREGGTGVVYWDGVELLLGSRLSPDYLDGDQPGGRWVNVPHNSLSVAEGGISSIDILFPNRPDKERGDRVSVTFTGPFTRGDTIVLSEGRASVVRDGVVLDEVLQIPPLNDGDALELLFHAQSKPVLTLTPQRSR